MHYGEKVFSDAFLRGDKVEAIDQPDLTSGACTRGLTGKTNPFPSSLPPVSVKRIHLKQEQMIIA
jgi:hypothetical protein